MTPAKAHALGVAAADLKVSCWADRYGGEWVAYVPDPDRGRRVLTQGSVYAVTGWAGALRELQEAS